MRQLVAIITVLHVLGHSVFGCCSHSDQHATPNAHCCHSAGDADCSHQSGQSQQLVQPQDGAENFALLVSNAPDSPHHICLHSTCQWLNSKSLNASDIMSWDFDVAVAVAPAALADFALPTLVGTPPDRAGFLGSALPLRLHLLLGVLQV